MSTAPEAPKLTWEPHWPSDEVLLSRAVRGVEPDGVRQRWALVRDRFAVGSTVAHALCVRFGVDPGRGCEEKALMTGLPAHQDAPGLRLAHGATQARTSASRATGPKPARIPAP